MRTTAAERRAYTDEALMYLNMAKAWRQSYADMLAAAFTEHGDGNGVLISGVAREHFPDTTKHNLRTLARGIGDYCERSTVSWRKAGRRLHTWRRMASEYRVDGCMY